MMKNTSLKIRSQFTSGINLGGCVHKPKKGKGSYSRKNKFSKFNTRKIMSPVIKERNSHLSQKVQQAKEGQDAYKGPDLIYEEKVYQRQFQSFGKVSGQRTNS